MSDIRIQKTGEPDILQTSDGRLTLSVPIQIKRRSGRKLVTLPSGETAPVRPWDVAPTSIQLALARGHRWLAMLESGEAKSLKEIATREGIDKSYVSRMVNLTTLAPDIVAASSDVPDDWQLRLVVLPPDAAFSKSGQSLAIERATEILKNRGDQPRFKKNRLIFLAADYDSVSRLKDQVRSTLAWQSIVSDIKEMKLNLDQFQSRQASKSVEDANEALRRMIRETYKWMVAPMQEARPGKGLSEIQWEHFQVNPGAQNLSQEIERVLKENELLITDWAPIHLATVLKNWFWKDGVKETLAKPAR